MKRIGLLQVLPVFLALAASMVARPAAAQFGTDLVLLDEKQVARLNETAREHYDRGVAFVDRVDYRVAARAFERASQAQPGHIDLAFLVANLSKDNGRRSFGAEADEFYQIALNALDRVMRRTDLDTLTQRRAEQLKTMIDREFRNRGTRDQRRLDTGMTINLQIAAQLDLEADVLQGRPRRTVTDPRAPLNIRTLGAGGPAGAGLGPTPVTTVAPPAAGGSPFGALGAGAGAPAAGGAGTSPFGAAGTTPFGGGGAGAPAASPFGAPAGGGAPTTSPFGAPAPPATGGSPFGTPPAPQSPFQ